MKFLFKIAFCGLALYTPYLKAQELHTPDEIIAIMEKSELSYSLEELEKPILPKDYSGNLNYDYFYIGINPKSGKPSLMEYAISEEAEKIFLQAEKSFKDGALGEARASYKKVLELEPEYHRVMTYLGQTYKIENQLDSAEFWFKRAIDGNHINYMAHWFLADIYALQNKLPEAARQITIAHVLNRNNPRIKTQLLDIYKKNKISYNEWTFTPQVEVTYEGEQEVSIKYADEWGAYALYKAVWKYEPGYKESMGVEEDELDVSFIAEKECLLGLLLRKDFDKKAKKDPTYKTLKTAFEEGSVELFILYEILLPQYPRLAFIVSAQSVEATADYVLRIRSGMKTKKK